MQRACLPPADYKTTTLPPSSGSNRRQHHARAAGPRYGKARCLSEPAIDHPTTLRTTSAAAVLAVCDRTVQHNTAISVIQTTDSNNSSKNSVLTPS